MILLLWARRLIQRAEMYRELPAYFTNGMLTKLVLELLRTY